MCVGTLWLYFRNSWWETIIESLIFLKCMFSFISFVKISLRIDDYRNVIDINILQLMAFANHIFWRFKCLIPFEVTEAAHWMASLLLLYILVWEYASGMTMSLTEFFSDWSYVAHSLVAIILDSKELKEVWFLQIDFRAIGSPERQLIKPDREWNLNSSIGVPSSTALLHLPAQLALQKAAIWWQSDGEGAVASV